MSTAASDECRQVLNDLMFDWPEEPGDDKSPAFYRHLCHCRGCLRKWIALEAAADLATIPLDGNGFSARESDCRDDGSAHADSCECPAPRSTAGAHPSR